MAVKSNWFLRGKEVFDKKKQLDIVAKARKERYIQRFFLKAGESAKIVFVDSEPFGIWEHNLRIDGKWGNFYTCCKEIQPCPICKNFPESRPTWTVYFTVLDLRPYTKRDGQTVKFRKILYPAKGSTIAKIEDLLNKYGSISGLCFKVSRLTDDDSNCGRDFEYIGKVDIVKKFGKEYAIPIDYAKVLAFPNDEELEYLGISSDMDVNIEDDEEHELDDNAILDDVTEPVEEVAEEVDIDDLVE